MVVNTQVVTAPSQEDKFMKYILNNIKAFPAPDRL